MQLRIDFWVRVRVSSVRIRVLDSDVNKDWSHKDKDYTYNLQ